jgi:hypothetical protein
VTREIAVDGDFAGADLYGRRVRPPAATFGEGQDGSVRAAEA